jgi:hypothetical protein
MVYYKDKTKEKDLSAIISSAPIKKEYKERISEVLQAQYDEINLNERNEFAAMGSLDILYYIAQGIKWATLSSREKLEIADKEEPGAILEYQTNLVMYLGEVEGKKWFFQKRGNYGLCELLDKEKLKQQENSSDTQEILVF